MLDRDLSSAKAAFFRAIGDETRLQILVILKDNGEQSVTEICCQIDREQATVSHHLACLRTCGLVTTRREGKNIIYALNSKEKISKILCLAEGHVQEAVEGILKCEVVG